MGSVTSPDSLPYPVDTDSPDIPRDFKALAEATQVALSKRGYGGRVRYLASYSLTPLTFWTPAWTESVNYTNLTPISATMGASGGLIAPKTGTWIVGVQTSAAPGATGAIGTRGSLLINGVAGTSFSIPLIRDVNVTTYGSASLIVDLAEGAKLSMQFQVTDVADVSVTGTALGMVGPIR